MTNKIKFGLFLPDSMNFNFDNSNILSDKNLIIYKDVDQYIKSVHDFKVAVLDMPIDENSNLVSKDSLSLRKNITENSDRVIIHNMEFHINDFEYVGNILKISNKHIFSINGVIHSDIPALNSMEWLTSTASFYKNNLRDILQNLNPYCTKEKYFDFLPGMPRPHRLKVAKFIKEYQLENKILSGKMFKNKAIDFGNTGFWPEELNKNYDLTNSFNYTIVNYKGADLIPSQIIPLDVFNQTCYSIVTETSTDNSFSFYTEKIAKPMLASRLFIVFSGKNYLKGLRSLGFKTFNGIIDESYDTVEDHEKRWRLAFEQVNYLCSVSQEDILEKISPIVAHNYRTIMNYDWIRNFKYFIEDLFLKKLMSKE